jgi:hypothetical protein
MASNALFLAPREADADRMFPNPAALPDLQDDEAEPVYDDIFVVRIDNANPATHRVTVRRLPNGALKVQADLDQSHLRLAEDPRNDIAGANSGRNLNLKFATKYDGGALVIFHMVDPNATFVDAAANGMPSHGIVKAAGAPDLIFQARWVRGSEHNREAISVILKPLPKGDKREQAYGLGVRLNNDDPETRTTDIIIDPKVENEGQGR